MLRKVLVAFGLALAVTASPLGALAHEGHDRRRQGKEGEEGKAEEGRRGDRRAAAVWVRPSIAMAASRVWQQMDRSQHCRND